MLKELSTKRVGFDKAAFAQVAGELLPVICQAWDAQWATIEGLLGALLAALSRGGADVLSRSAGMEAVETFALATVCVKVTLSCFAPRHCPLSG